MSIALGNNKPESLLEVEKMVWRALFEMSEGLKLPEVVVEWFLPKIPWEKLQLDSSQWNWFDIRAPPLPPIAPGPPDLLLTQTSPPVSTSPSLPALALPDLMDTTLDHEVQVAIVNEQPESPILQEGDSPDLQSVGTVEEDMASQEGPSDAITTHRSAQLGSKDESEEGGAESRVKSTSGTGAGRLSTPRKRKMVKNPKQMNPPVPMKSALKRKEPPEVEKLLSGGSSPAMPIDVDALNTVLERFPVKHELQVCNCNMPTIK